MTRVKSKAAIRHRKVKAEVKGFKHSNRKRVKNAKESLLHSGQYAYVGRKLRKRDLRRLWIVRLNAAARERGMSYNALISGLKKSNVEIDRKILADLAVNEPDTFTKIIDSIK